MSEMQQEFEDGDSRISGTDFSPSTHEFPKIISFETLTRCGDEIWIENSGQIYRLRRTRQSKLILTK